jgi:hypothetical protein
MFTGVLSKIFFLFRNIIKHQPDLCRYKRKIMIGTSYGLDSIIYGPIINELYPNIILINQVANTGNSASRIVTQNIDTTTADFIVVALMYYNTQPATNSLIDSKSNTWQPLSVYGASSRSYVRLYYSYNPTVGTNHNFSTGTENDIKSICVAAFKGLSITSNVYYTDTDKGNTSDSSLTINPGSITPSDNKVLLISAWVGGDTLDNNPTIDSNFIRIINTSTNIDSAIAYFITSNKNPVSPIWTSTNDTKLTSSIAAFRIGDYILDETGEIIFAEDDTPVESSTS